MIYLGACLVILGLIFGAIFFFHAFLDFIDTPWPFPKKWPGDKHE
jgi:hypothetical protein